jgi:hypothetical protein
VPACLTFFELLAQINSLPQIKVASAAIGQTSDDDAMRCDHDRQK